MIVMVPRFGRVAAVQVTVPPREFTAGPVQVPELVVADVNRKPDGITCLKTTFGASAPLLLTVHVYPLAELTLPLPWSALPVTARSVVIPVLFGGGGGGSVLAVALLVASGVPAVSVPLAVAVLVMDWSCAIRTMNGMRPTTPGSIVPILQEKLTTLVPPAVQVATPPFTETMFDAGRIVTVPDPLVAAAPACE